MTTTPETVIRFAGHDLTLTGDMTNINILVRAIRDIEHQPEHLTDVFNLSSASDEFYKFEINAVSANNGLSISGEKHFLWAIHEQLMKSPKKYYQLSESNS